MEAEPSIELNAQVYEKKGFFIPLKKSYHALYHSADGDGLRYSAGRDAELFAGRGSSFERFGALTG